MASKMTVPPAMILATQRIRDEISTVTKEDMDRAPDNTAGLITGLRLAQSIMLESLIDADGGLPGQGGPAVLR